VAAPCRYRTSRTLTTDLSLIEWILWKESRLGRLHQQSTGLDRGVEGC
jgi:hypothetical protein